MKFFKNKKFKIVLITFLLAIDIFLLVFFYYCPAHYVKTSDGKVSLVNGEPSIYHTDIFGNTFVFDHGIRVYISVPEYREEVTDEELLSQLRSDFNSK